VGSEMCIRDRYKEVREQRPKPDTLQLFEFEVEDPPFSPTVQDLFEEAALILSFVAANDKCEVYVRAPVKGYEHVWSKLQKEQAKSRSKRKGSIPEDTIAHRPLATLVRAAEDAKGKVFAIAVEDGNCKPLAPTADPKRTSTACLTRSGATRQPSRARSVLIISIRKGG